MERRKLYKSCPYCHAIWEIRFGDDEDFFRTCPICRISDYLPNEGELHGKHWRLNSIDKYLMGKASGMVENRK